MHCVFVRRHVYQLEGRVHIRNPVLRRLPEPNSVVLDLAKELGLHLTGSASLESFSVPSYERHGTHGSQKIRVGTNKGWSLSLFGGKFLMLPWELRIKEEPALSSGWLEAKGSQPHTGGPSCGLTGFFSMRLFTVTLLVVCGSGRLERSRCGDMAGEGLWKSWDLWWPHYHFPKPQVHEL